MWSIKKQSVVKPENDVFANGVERMNEDAIIEHSYGVALSDGAGGCGLFAAQWAKVLVEHMPCKPLISVKQMSEWITGFWEPFYEKHLLIAQSDPFLLNKYENEGSLATYSALWIDKELNKISYTTYGDSMVLIYDKISGELSVQNYFNDFSVCNKAPYLLNWKDEVIAPNSFVHEPWIDAEPNKVYMLASDALAQMIYAYYLVSVPKGKKMLQTEILNGTRVPGCLRYYTV